MLLHKYLLKKHKIVLLQGENGRKLVEKNLKKKGFNVSTIECYKRILKNLNIEKEEKLWCLYKINTLVVTSSEILYHIKNIICSINENNWLLTCKIFVISRRLFKIAKILGWKDIVISNCASNECLIKVIKKEKFGN
ncbi:MAG: uroporphyrinogen-III synthase [Buchnera aphidicola (Brevicoryne brassicae)]|uniref:Uroporphyrinogen-III synthase n=1 Tax=Buchnera aphidicola (Brevicoryne brassicae) TaxID=911343 RepID=A0AAJ5PUV6_9GAMM|nr:uroporphyrinogen-III synthase [Buchnera aphidicola]WAI19253.1 MAG: uroporphyrinogen-III synthase [Buchnera aphidicola (Brevicoryne brassicae)]